MERKLSVEDVVELHKAFFRKFSPVNAQIESYHKYLKMIPEIIHEHSELKIPDKARNEIHIINFGEVKFSTPSIKEKNLEIRRVLPHECRKRNLNYSGAVFVDVHVRIEDDKGNHVRDVFYPQEFLFKNPVMVRSCLCYTSDPFTWDKGDFFSMGESLEDPGGYFIMKGNEKVIVSQEKRRYNVPIITLVKNNPRYCLMNELRSWNENKIRSTSTIKMMLGNNSSSIFIDVLCPFINWNIPCILLFKALGVQTLDEMKYYVAGTEQQRLNEGEEFYHYLQQVFNNYPEYLRMNQQDSIAYIASKGVKGMAEEKKSKSVINILNNEFFPQLGLTPDETKRKKTLYYLGYMIRRLLIAYVYVADAKRLGKNLNEATFLDDIDSYANKRIDCAGQLLAYLFRQSFREALKTITKRNYNALNKKGTRYPSEERNVSMREVFDFVEISNDLKYSLNTGNWYLKKRVGMQTLIPQKGSPRS